MARWRAPTPLRRNAASNDFRSADYWRARLGRKVSLRYTLHDDPSHPFSEAVGVVASVEGEGDGVQVSVINRRGETRTFQAGEVLATKDMP